MSLVFWGILLIIQQRKLFWKGMDIMREEKRTSVFKIILISATVAIAIVGIVAVLYRLFKKYFKISIDCGDCEDCDCCTADCFGEDFDPLCDCDEDYMPKCNLDEAEEA